MRRTLASLVLIGLVSAGCGARWSDEQRASVEARQNSSGDGPSSAAQTGQVAGGQSAPSTAVSGGATVASDSPSGGGPAVAGGGGAEGEGGPAPATARPCAATTDAPGVTDADITIGAINSLSGPLPGLGATYQAATQAYAAYRNSTGGVCGRQVEVVTADDGFDNARYRSILIDFDPSVLGVVTGIAVGGDGGAGDAAERNIPMTGTPITSELFSSPVVFGVRPSYANYDVPTPRFRYLYEQGVRRGAIVFVNAGVAVSEAERHRRLMQAAGIEVVSFQGLPLSTLSYDSTARAIVNSGADYVFGLLEETGSSGLARSLHDIDAPLLGQEYPAAYGTDFPELAGEAAEGVSSWIDVLPVEDGGVNPEQAAMIEWMAISAPGTNIDVFASLAWVATKAFLDSLEALPGPITRDALLSQLRGTNSYDAGGMLAPIDLGAQVTSGCLLAMVVDGGAWRRMIPADGFAC